MTEGLTVSLDSVNEMRKGGRRNFLGIANKNVTHDRIASHPSHVQWENTIKVKSGFLEILEAKDRIGALVGYLGHGTVTSISSGSRW